MHLFNILTAFAIANLAQGFTIPAGTVDGVYSVTTRDDGTVVHTKLSPAEAKRAASGIEPVDKRTTLERRQAGRIWCGCGFTLDQGNCDAAVADLKSQMRPSIVNAGLSFYSIRGSVVAFACNRSSGTNWLLYPQDYADALGSITNACGRYIAGAIERGDSDQALLYGYQRWSAGTDFCADATTSPVNHC